MTSTTELAKKEMQQVIREQCLLIREDFSKGVDRFKALCQTIKDAGYPPNDAWNIIKDELGEYVPKSTLYRWSDKILPPEAKDQNQRNRTLGYKNAVPIVGTGTVVGRLNEPTQEYNFSTEGMGVAIPDEEDDTGKEQQLQLSKGTPERYGVEHFEFEKLNTYSLEYCREVIKWLIEVQDEYTNDAFKWDNKITVLARDNEQLKKKLDEYQRIPSNDALVNQIDELKKENQQLMQTNIEASDLIESLQKRIGELLGK
jgi:hypothetical protein